MKPLLIAISIVTAIVLFLTLVVYLIRKKVRDLKEARKKLFEQYAQNKKVQLAEDDVFGLQEKIGTMVGLGVAGNPLKNIACLPGDRGDILLFDQLKIPRSNAGSEWGVFTICFIEAARPFGADIILNEAVNETAANVTRDMGELIPGMAILTFDDQLFDGRFVVTSEQEENAKNLLNKEVREFLITSAKKVPVPLSIQIKGNYLAVYSSASSTTSLETEAGLDVLVDIANGLAGIDLG